MSPTVDQK